MSAESFGLSLIEARRLYDVWREHPAWSSRQIAKESAAAYYYGRGHVANMSKYVDANRAKWASFNAPAVSDSQLEAPRQKRFLCYCRAVGYLAYKVEAPGMSGIPDTQVIDWHGHIAFVEMKKPGEKPDPIQAHVMGELTKRGHLAFWDSSPEHAFRTIVEFFHKEAFQCSTPRASATRPRSDSSSNTTRLRSSKIPGSVKRPKR